MRVDLILVPFFDMHYIHAGISCLKAYLHAKGIDVSVHNLNLLTFDYFKEKLPFWKPSFGNDIPFWGERKRTHPGLLLFSMLLYPDYHKGNAYLRNACEAVYGVDLAELKNDFESEFGCFLSRMDLASSALIGISINEMQVLPAICVAGKIKRMYPDIPVVIGGPFCFAELSRRLLERFECFDIAVVGEGERVLYEIAGEIDNPGRRAKIKGTVQRRDSNDIVVNPPRSQMTCPELDALPHPDLGWSNFTTLSGELPIIGSRGCYYARCLFCNDIAWWRCHRERSVHSIVAELEAQSEKYNNNKFRFYDLAINSDLGRMHELCDAITSLGKEFDMWCLMRTDNIDRGLFIKMKNAGFNRVRFGWEAISTSLLKKMRKGTSAFSNLRSAVHAKDAGIKFVTSLIRRYPLERSEDVIETLNMVKRYPSLLNANTVIETYDYKWRHGSRIGRDAEPHGSVKLRAPTFPSHFYPPGIRDSMPYVEYFVDCDDENAGIRDDLWNSIQKNLEMNTVSYLQYRHDDAGLVVEMRRPLEKEREIALDEDQRLVFLALEDLKSYAELCSGLDLDEDAIRKCLSMLVREGLVHAERVEGTDKYINVTVPAGDGRLRADAGSGK